MAIALNKEIVFWKIVAQSTDEAIERWDRK